MGEEILAMNRNYTQFRFPQVRALPWRTVFNGITYDNREMPEPAIQLIKEILVFNPKERIKPFDALGHEFFDVLRVPNMTPPKGNSELPPLFNLTQKEFDIAVEKDILTRI